MDFAKFEERAFRQIAEYFSLNREKLSGNLYRKLEEKPMTKRTYTDLEPALVEVGSVLKLKARSGSTRCRVTSKEKTAFGGDPARAHVVLDMLDGGDNLTGKTYRRRIESLVNWLVEGPIDADDMAKFEEKNPAHPKPFKSPTKAQLLEALVALTRMGPDRWTITARPRSCSMEDLPVSPHVEAAIRQQHFNNRREAAQTKADELSLMALAAANSSIKPDVLCDD
jgi:hypothetical protein